MAMLCPKCGRADSCSNIHGGKHKCPKPVTAEQVHKETIRFLKAKEESEKRSMKTNMKFGIKKEEI
jgi:hypothetical protein